MAFGINSRRIKKALRRLKSLPGGLNFFKYTANKVHAWYLKKTKSGMLTYKQQNRVQKNICGTMPIR